MVFSWWHGLESFERNLAREGRELYIIAGGRGHKADIISQDGFLINVPERVWKVIIVLDKPGQTIADVDKNTIAFAVDLPNIDPANDTDINPTDWQDYVISVRELENRLESQRFNDYDFLSKIPISLQNIVEQRNRTEILQWINNNMPPTAQLLAVPDTTIGHKSVFEDSSFKTLNIEISSISQKSMAEIGIFEIGFRQIGTSQISITEVGISEIGFNQASINQNSTSQISPLQISFSKIYPLHISPTEISIHKTRQIHNRIAKVSIPENNVSEIDIEQFSLREIDPSEISFASSIPSKQFFNIHNSTHEIMNILNNTATNI